MWKNKWKYYAWNRKKKQTNSTQTFNIDARVYVIIQQYIA